MFLVLSLMFSHNYTGVINLEEEYHRDQVEFSILPIRVDRMSTCLITGVVNVHDLGKVFARFSTVVTLPNASITPPHPPPATAHF